MIKSERQRLRQLANDTLIDCFGSENREQKLAQALEEAVDHVEYLRVEWRPICDCGLHLKTYEEAYEDGEV